MRKTYSLPIITSFTVLLLCFCVLAVSTTKIDTVRKKATLADSDTAIIEDFLAEALNEFLTKTDFSDIASLRTAIVSRSTSETASGQFQYGPRFATATQKQITETAAKISQMPDSQNKNLLTMNLLIIVNDLNNIELSKMAFDYLQKPDTMIRYWAVNCLTNNNTLRQLNGAENSRLAEQITGKLQTVTQTEQSSAILILLSQFACDLKLPASTEIMNEIAQKRIQLYLNWQVKDETTENWILKALAERPTNDPASAPIMAKDFAILYSLVIQRYMLGQEALPQTNLKNLASVITLTEKTSLLKFVPEWAGTFKRAIDKGGGAGLLAESDSLFGSANTAGKLPTAMNFDYGKTPDGSVKTAPPTLPKPPKTEKQPENKPEEKPEETPEEPVEPNQ